MRKLRIPLQELGHRFDVLRGASDEEDCFEVSQRFRGHLVQLANQKDLLLQDLGSAVDQGDVGEGLLIHHQSLAAIRLLEHILDVVLRHSYKV